MEDDGRARPVGCIRIRFTSPRRVMSRWFSSPTKVKGKKNKKTAMADARVSSDDCKSIRIRNISEEEHRVADFSDSSPQTISSELQRREFMFSLGVSCYLLRLIATSREEMNKIIELRNDIEKFLEIQNNEIRRKQQEFVEIRKDIEKVVECHNDILRRKQQVSLLWKQERSETCAYSNTSDVVDGLESSTDHYYSPQLTDSSLCVGLEESLRGNMFKLGKGSFGGEMDQLEAELEAEFELLQMGQDQEGQSSQLKEDEDSEGVMLGPVEEQQGVCPYELERRLRELLETRQKEEIKDLEFALENAKKMLHVKEAEASWWKDTAYIVSEHIPEPSRLIPNTQTRRYPLSR